MNTQWEDQEYDPQVDPILPHLTPDFLNLEHLRVHEYRPGSPRIRWIEQLEGGREDLNESLEEETVHKGLIIIPHWQDEQLQSYAVITTQFGTSGNDVISGGGLLAGGAGNDGLTGGAGADILNGGSGSDTLNGGSEADILEGGADTDMLKGGGGADYLDGGEGYDGVSFAGAAGGVTINLATNQHGGYATGVTIVNIESVQATAFADTLTGRERGNGQGVDLHADGGNDTLIGSAGQEGLFGGEGDDWFDGRDGADTIHGWTGHDAVHGGDGNDSVYGGEGNDWLSGGDGADLLDGGADWDTVSYLGATSGVVVDLTTNGNGGAAAGDVISGVEVLQGSHFDDRLTSIDRGHGQGGQLYGEGGSDQLYGKNGGDCLFGGAGNDWLDGGFGGDILTGGDGLDYFAFASALAKAKWT
jgi:Ca2+-binding RTX toxin-like protein